MNDHIVLDICYCIRINYGLDYYDKLVQYFKSAKHYDSERNVIVDPLGWNIGDPDDPGDIVIINHEYTFEDWFRTVSTSKEFQERVELSNMPVKSVDELAEIIANFMKAILNNKDVEIIYRFMEKCILAIENQFQELKIDASNNLEYLNIIDIVSLNTVAKIRDIFSINTEIYVGSVNYQDKLEFYLNQTQLTALIYLISESEFLKKNDKIAKNKFYTFCQKYFYCIKDGSEEYTQLTNLSKNLNKAKNGQYQTALKHLFLSMEKVVDNS